MFQKGKQTNKQKKANEIFDRILDGNWDKREATFILVLKVILKTRNYIQELLKLVVQRDNKPIITQL